MSEQPHLLFFERHYRALRKPYKPMRWMRRLFTRLLDGKAPKLVDLPTGAGKTELVVVWLIALAWYAQDRDGRTAIPRRLVWVVNRKVLVQQVFDVARALIAQIDASPVDAAADLAGFHSALASLCRTADGPVFKLTQLRGQLVDDREWSLDPTVPQLIIGTVDQIGSRLLFQGYGQGKWARPQHAAFFGVDAWVCIDEAHLVPAFAHTLRQVAVLGNQPIFASARNTPLTTFFSRLPFWTTELSATPALARPSDDQVLARQSEDETDEQIESRLLAAATRRVVVESLPIEKQLVPRIADAALAFIGNKSAVAVFVRTANAAQDIAAKLRKDRRVGADRVLLVTGRLRGYERDRLQQGKAFAAFRRHEPQVADHRATCFLVGTAAAEVGLDADADAILCDFAPMPTLLQRLGRLDRRGALSKAFIAREREEPPTMTIFSVDADEVVSGRDLSALASALGSADYIESFAALPWRRATEDKKDKAGEQIESLIRAATWSILAPQKQPVGPALASPPYAWLGHTLAAVSVGPTVTPPLTSAVLQQWTATTPRPSRFLPVHPWLYGLLPSDDGTPLVGIAFRLELDALQTAPIPSEIDESEIQESENIDTRLREILHRFPPLRAELHYVPLWTAAEHLSSNAAAGDRFARFDGEEWTTSSSRIPKLRPGDILVFGTTVSESFSAPLLEGTNQSDVATCDVFDAVSEGAARYRREIETQNADASSQLSTPQVDVRRWMPFEAPTGATGLGNSNTAVSSAPGWEVQRGDSWKTKIGETFVTFRYFTKKRPPASRQFLLGHQKSAAISAAALTHAIAPKNDFIARLLNETAAVHDEGKSHPPWQRAMGNSDLANPIAKPVVERPASTNGYRHEWGSLLKIADHLPSPPSDWSEAMRQVWRDLWLHLIGAHHGFLRPSLPDRAFPRPPTMAKQLPLRMAAIERFARLQSDIGPWRLAYLEALLKSADVDASRAYVEEADES